jgi:hypothetical protein
MTSKKNCAEKFFTSIDGFNHQPVETLHYDAEKG